MTGDTVIGYWLLDIINYSVASDVTFKTDKSFGNKSVYFSVAWKIFFEYFERFFSSRFCVFIGIGLMRLYHSNTEAIFRFEKSWPFCLVWTVIRSMVCYVKPFHNSIRMDLGLSTIGKSRYLLLWCKECTAVSQF